jgi:ubiquinone/menaquinone biosynthesis C-methylase UbiE
MFSVQHLNNLRSFELKKIVAAMTPGARVLEVGAGTGQQAAEIRAQGYPIEAIEIPSSNYTSDRLFPITDYDGLTIPFPDNSFDIVFSSNVLEHVPDLTNLHSEIRRVLAPGGYCLHVLPTHAWRFWTTVSAFPDAAVYAVTKSPSLLPGTRLDSEERARLRTAWFQMIKRCAIPFFPLRHGERGNAISEMWLFHPNWWRKNFEDNGFEVVSDQPMGLFYTGNMVAGSHWSFASREAASRVLGSACYIFKIRPRHPAAAATP